MVRLMMSLQLYLCHFGDMHWKHQHTFLNLVPSKSVPKTLLELWNGRKLSLHYIQIWGCPAHVLKGKTEKLESKSEICLFVRYPKGTRGYYFYSPLDRKVFVSTNATFLEDKYINEHQFKSKVVLEEMSGSNSTSSIPETQSHNRQPLVLDIPKQCVLSGRDESSNSMDQVNVEGIEEDPPSLRQSQRVIRPPFMYLLVGESNKVISTAQVDDLTSYKEAMNDVDADLSQQAINTEMESMHSNQVWKLVDAPEGIKHIGSF
ncbi:uncharacterized protein LOC111409440 [Olea europaea var. sylvestris]|uniref:uncharacterized protein LOC111409440 n=1 Tax=Olea europaea var. sylvestris TaxID=158386 RepID=UPI000C1D5C13|nr:uncharacterized protein LOC111409440 [Olea europaea var. sylvestris]